MDGFKSAEEMAGRAFALAYFIHGDRRVALSVVREALAKLEVAAAAQSKRLYYTPSPRALWRRPANAHGRTKVSLSDLHLLQRLVYVESEPHERERERRREALREDELLVHFVKHLVRISIKRNSFYVAVGVSRLLHDYTTSETMEIYNIVVQDPERVKDDYYYRSRKGRLLQEIKERFDDLLSVCRVQRGEERFQTADEPGEFSELVAECLRHFSPWQTACAVPRGYDPTSDEIPALSSAHTGEEDKAEINRIHAVVHPDCYELLTGALKLEPPALRLSVPRFNLPNGKNKMPGPKDKPRRPAPPLGGDELEALRQHLAAQSARRRATHANLLSVAVDSVERARIDLGVSGSVSVSLEEGDELVEVSALDGGERTLLAAHLLGGQSGGAAAPAKSEVVLEGGQKLSFTLSPAPVGDGGARASLDIAYRETEWRRSVALSLRRLTRKAGALVGFEGRSGRSPLRPAFAALLLVVAACALALLLFKSARRPSDAELAADTHQPASTHVTPDATTRNDAPQPNDNDEPSANVAASQPQSPNAARGVAANKSPTGAGPRSSTTPRVTTQARAARPDTSPRQSTIEQTQAASSRAGSETEGGSTQTTKAGDTDTTRSVGQVAGATALSTVSKVFIDVAGDRELSEQTSRLLADRLRGGRRLTPTDVKDEADAAFKISVSARQRAARGSASGNPARDSDPAKRTVTLSVRLVNEDGEVIWPVGNKGVAVYKGTLKDVTDRLAADLLKNFARADAQK